MSNSDAKARPKVTAELIEDIVKRARQERQEAIQQLFGFGFTALKDAVRGGQKTPQDGYLPGSLAPRR